MARTLIFFFLVFGLSAQASEPFDTSLVREDCVAARTNIVGIWHLNEGAGSTTFVDSSYSTNDGACVGSECPTMGKDGVFGTAAQFDGPNNFITVNDHVDLDNTDKLTFQFWAFPTASDNSPRGIVSKRTSSSSQQAWSIFKHTNDDLYVDIDKQSTNNRFAMTNDFSTINRWYHVSVVYDGTQASTADRILTYFNGAADSSNATSVETSTSIGAYTSDLHIGTLNSGYGQHFIGHIDEVLVYRDALTAAQVKGVYECGRWRHRLEGDYCNGLSCEWEVKLPYVPGWLARAWRGFQLT